MSWIAEKIDAFIAAAAIALAGAAASQVQPFTIQYLHRTGVALEEARTHLDDVRVGLRYRVMGDTVRSELEADATARVTTLERAYDSVLHANPVIRPIVVSRRGDPGIVAATRQGFVPAVPTSTSGIAFTIIGMIAGFVVYEAIKLPVITLAREPRRRRFRKRG